MRPIIIHLANFTSNTTLIVRARIRSLVLKDLDELVEARGKKCTEEWAEPVDLITRHVSTHTTLDLHATNESLE